MQALAVRMKIFYIVKIFFIKSAIAEEIIDNSNDLHC